MKQLKLFFSALTVAFAIQGLTHALPTQIAMPIMFIGLAATILITAKEYRAQQKTRTAIYFLLLGIFFADRYCL